MELRMGEVDEGGGEEKKKHCHGNKAEE